MTLRIFAMPGNETFAGSLGSALGADTGALATRHFPDGETYVRLDTPVASLDVVFVCTLDRPDAKALPLLFAADAARDQGARSVGLVTPYLSYMRQDRRFQPGEAISSVTFARLLSGAFDWIVTVDPHLHRRSSMSEIYSVPVGVCHAAPSISAWIKDNVDRPVLIGPDSESEQWVSSVAEDAGAPFTVLEKTRRGDREVDIVVRDIETWRQHQPVLVDDIISSGRTMEVALKQLLAHGLPAPVIVGVHAIFAEDAHARLLAVGAGQVVSTNTVPHVSNAIDLTALVAQSVTETLTPS